MENARNKLNEEEEKYSLSRGKTRNRKRKN